MRLSVLNCRIVPCPHLHFSEGGWNVLGGRSRWGASLSWAVELWKQFCQLQTSNWALVQRWHVLTVRPFLGYNTITEDATVTLLMKRCIGVWKHLHRMFCSQICWRHVCYKIRTDEKMSILRINFERIIFCSKSNQFILSTKKMSLPFTDQNSTVDRICVSLCLFIGHPVCGVDIIHSVKDSRWPSRQKHNTCLIVFSQKGAKD